MRISRLPWQPTPKASTKDYNYQISFTKPITSSYLDTVSYSIDSLIKISLPVNSIQWNKHKTDVFFQLPFAPEQYQDTLKSLVDFYKPDSLETDTAKLLLFQRYSKVDPNKVVLTIPPATFISADQDTTVLLSQTFKLLDNREKGIIKLQVTTEEPSYFIQLMTTKSEVFKQLYNCETCTFDEVPPGEYFIRVLIDKNNNGKWDIGNIRNLVEPEPIIYFMEKSALRANWQIDLEYSF